MCSTQLQHFNQDIRQYLSKGAHVQDPVSYMLHATALRAWDKLAHTGTFGAGHAMDPAVLELLCNLPAMKQNKFVIAGEAMPQRSATFSGLASAQLKCQSPTDIANLEQRFLLLTTVYEHSQ